MSVPDPAGPPRSHDLRLVGPAVAVWLTAAVSLGAGSVAAYTAATVAATATLVVLRSPAPPPAAYEAVGAASAVGADPTGLRAKAAGRARWARCRRTISGVRRHHRAVAGATLAGVAAAAACTGLRLSAVESGPLRALALAGESASIVAEVTTDPQSKPSRHPGRTVVVVRARALSVRSRGRTVRVRVPMLILAGRHWSGLSPSQPVRFTARLVAPSRGALLAAVGLVRGPPAVLGPPSAVQRAAETVRTRLREAASTLPPDQRGVLPGLVLGDTSLLDPELESTFVTAGLSHLLVVSGANLSLVAGAILGLARLARLGRRRSVALAAVAIVAFVVVVRPEPSVLRATAMALIGLVALVSGRERRGVPALCAAVVLLVLADPELARAYGFALSVLATAGLLLLAPRWRAALARRLPVPLADAVAVAAAAQLVVLPVLVTLSGEIGLVAIPANVLAAPAVAPATLLGAVTAAVAPVAMPLARILIWPAGLAVGWICGVARGAAAVPYPSLSWPGGAMGGLAFAAIAIVGVLSLRHAWARRMAAAALAGVLCVAVTATVLAPDWPPRRWRLVACDVGQGDALVLAAGPGAAVVVDTGPEPGAIDRCLRDLGITAIPLLVLTHPHADHVGGMTGAVRDRSLGAVLLSPATAAGQWRNGLPTGRAPVRFARAGQRWTAGEVTLTVLGPPPMAAPVFPGDDGSAVNNVSVVVLARWPGLSALLTGDAEEDEQRALLEAGLPPATVLKVPHHGSDRQDTGFLAASGARLALISVGRANDYGHPAPELTRLLHRLAMRSYRTDQHGDIAITRSGTGLAVIPRGPSSTGRNRDRGASAAGDKARDLPTGGKTGTSAAIAARHTTGAASSGHRRAPCGTRRAPCGTPGPGPANGSLNPRAGPPPRRASRVRRARR